MDIRMIYWSVSIFLLYSGFLLCFGQDTFYFSDKPIDQDVVVGSKTVIPCDVSNRKHIVFQWLHNGKLLPNTSRRYQEDSDLRIMRVNQEEDGGPFQCIATNITTGFSLQSFEANLNIQWIEDNAEVQLKRPKKEEIALKVDVILKCQITGNPMPTFLWYRNKFRLFETNRVKFLDGGRVRVIGITAADNGVYTCRAENVAGARDSATNLLMNVYSPGSPHLVEENFTQYLLVRPNYPGRLDCSFVNATRIDWFSNYGKLSNNSRHTVFRNGSLYFSQLRMSDEGSYRCEGLSETSPAQTFTSELVLAHLDDFTSDSFEPRLLPNRPIVVPIHDLFEVKFFPPQAKPQLTFRWLDRNGMPVGNTGKIHVDGHKLVFEDPEQIDSGNYTVIISNMAGEKTKKVWIIMSVPPIVRYVPRPQKVEEEKSVVFNCQVVGTPYPVTTIYWLKDGRSIPSNQGRFRIDITSGTLRITNIHLSDAGNYACLVNTSGHTLVTSSQAYLTVTKKLKFNPEPKNAKLELNSKSNITCIAEAEVKPAIRWIRGTNFEFDSHIVEEGGTLHFKSVQRSDAGAYTCIAHSNTQGFINATIQVDVVERPQIQLKPKNTTAYEGQAVMLHCVAIGDPKPTILWDKNSKYNAWDFSRVKVYTNGTLFISQVYMEDKGMYGCTANNTAGKVKIEAFLDVASADDFLKDHQDKEDGFNMMKTIIIAVCSAGAYLALVIGLTAFCSYRLLLQRRNRKAMLVAKTENGDVPREQHELLEKERDRESGGQLKSDSDNRSHISGMSSQPSHSSQSRSRRGSYDRLKFPRHDLQTLGVLGKGLYGDVFLAKAHGIKDGETETLVVVKSLLSKDEQTFFDFKIEMDMYARLDHPNIVRLLGVCRDIEPQFMITEYCDWGDLKQFLLATRKDNGKRIARIPPLTTAQKVSMCSQVALGMEHLSNHRMVFKDLAARNVLLTSRLELKLASLSLCRDVYAGEYYPHSQNLIPLRWMPPEAALEEDYSTKSDIWAFGIFMWEVFHSGDLPYKSFTDEEVLKRLKVFDMDLDIGEQCPEEIIDLIRKCMQESPHDRPMFSELCIMLGELMAECEM